MLENVCCRGRFFWRSVVSFAAMRCLSFSMGKVSQDRYDVKDRVLLINSICLATNSDSAKKCVWIAGV